MIRGPVLPEARAALWALVAPRLDMIERGLALCCEAIDCSEGRFGVVDGLARDANGAAVLVVVASNDDPHLAPRVLAAAEFLVRVGDGLAAAAPEAALCAGQVGRVVVIGGPAATASLELLRRFTIPSLEVCRLEAFRIGGVERFAVRWLGHDVGAASARPQTFDFQVPAARRDEWRAVQRLCERLDPAIRIDGGRFQQRITWQGRELAEVVTRDGDLFALGAGGEKQALLGPRDVRGFGDSLLRRYLRAADITLPRTATASPSTRGVDGGPNARGVETLRETLSASRLSPEEYSMLGGPTCVAMPESDGGTSADYVARMVGEPDGSWTEPRPRD